MDAQLLDPVPGPATPVTAPATPVRPVEVLGCDAAATLTYVVAQRRIADAAAVRELRAVTHWADLHRVGHVGAIDPETSEWIDDDPQRSLAAATSSLGLEGQLRLAGEGAFMVEEFAVTELATALGISEHAGRAYVGQAVELRDRLPLCWAQVMAGNLLVWKARRIAEQTIPLTAEVAEAVDASLAPFAAKMTPHRIERAVDAAILRHDPDLAKEREDAAAEKRGAWFEDRLDGTTDLNALLDTPDAHALDHALDTLATTLGALGDRDARDVRRARALGVLADPQYTLDLTDMATPDNTPTPTTGTATTGTTGTGTGAGTGTGTGQRRAKRLTPTLHLHLHLDALQATDTCLNANGSPRDDSNRDDSNRARHDDIPGVHLGRVDKPGRQLGARSRAVIERWIAGLTPDTHLTITPVVDLTAHISIDAYEIPPPLRRQIAERDHHCRFPWCTNTGHYDIDHIEPYLDPDQGGPPAQTNTHNLARLCRFHHRVKTRSDWHYTHDPTTGTLTWTSPQRPHLHRRRARHLPPALRVRCRP